MKKAVLLMSMGGPRNLAEVRPFLFRLFSDPAIMRLPNGLRQLVAFLIAALRASKAKEIYKKMGGFSPLVPNTRAQAEALEKEAQKHGDYRCFIGMSYSEPFIRQAIQEIKKDKPDEIILLPLYPQYSTTTSASVLREAEREIKKQKLVAVVKTIKSFPYEEGFVASMAEKLRSLYEEAKNFGPPQALFSAHGLPEKIVLAGDPYPQECEKTAAALVKKTGIEGLDWTLCYQSRVGPLKWIGPETRAEVCAMAKQKRPVILVPIAFVSEHAETLVELEMDYRELAEKEGCPFFAVVPTVSTNPAFIKGLADLVVKH